MEQIIGGARRRRRLPLVGRRAWQAWIAVAVTVSVMAVCQPERTVTHNYRDACRNWFTGRPIYSGGVHGFLYFPHAAILYAPFTLPTPLGGILWRWVSIGALAAAVWRLAGHAAPEKPHAAFGLMTWLALGPALASARNGQMNLLLTALLTLAFSEIADRRWSRAACWLCLGAALKPLMIVPMGIAAAVDRPLWRPLLSGAALLFLLPFFTQHPSYVWEQYRQCAHKLLLAGNPGAENPGSDLFGLLTALGYAAPLKMQTMTRVAAGAVTLLLAIFAARRAAFPVFALAACYLALFNPRMENNGFVLLGPVMGWLAVESLRRGNSRLVAVLMAIASLAMTFSFQITGGHNFWLCPLMGLVVWFCAIKATGHDGAKS